MRFLNFWLVPFLCVTAAYLICFYLTFLVIAPIQEGVVGQIPLFASLLYLPHGVRVLAAQFYGWKSVVLLAPAAIQTHYYLLGWEGLSGSSYVPAFWATICAPLSFTLLKMLNLDVRGDARYMCNWRYLLLVGALASVMNAAGASLYYSNLTPLEAARSALAFLIGDIGGQFVMMFLLMLSFRWARGFPRFR